MSRLEVTNFKIDPLKLGQQRGTSANHYVALVFPPSEVLVTDPREMLDLVGNSLSTNERKIMERASSALLELSPQPEKYSKDIGQALLQFRELVYRSSLRGMEVTSNRGLSEFAETLSSQMPAFQVAGLSSRIHNLPPSETEIRSALGPIADGKVVSIFPANEVDIDKHLAVKKPSTKMRAKGKSVEENKFEYNPSKEFAANPAYYVEPSLNKTFYTQEELNRAQIMKLNAFYKCLGSAVLCSAVIALQNATGYYDSISPGPLFKIGLCVTLIYGAYQALRFNNARKILKAGKSQSNQDLQ